MGTRLQASAARRRALYQGRIDAAGSERDRNNAVVGWWLAEWKRLTPLEQAVERERLTNICKDMNGRIGRDGQ